LRRRPRVRFIDTPAALITGIHFVTSAAMENFSIIPLSGSAVFFEIFPRTCG
jgi:hypothetical protein